MTVLGNEISKLEEFFSDKDFSTGVVRYDPGGPYGYTSNLRLDYAVEAGEEFDLSEMFKFFRMDLEDILVRGDTSLTSDPSLKSFDGINKKNRYPKAVHLPTAAMSREYVANSRWYTTPVYEYTLYVRVFIEWD